MGEATSKPLMRVLGIGAAAVVIGLNFVLLWQTIGVAANGG
jgi:Mn2+/Fe2+ NRAMP family transporter